MNNELPSHAVRARRFFYGPRQETCIAFVGSRDECIEFVERDKKAIYYLGHNESGRWDLRIVTTKSLSPSARAKAEFKFWEQSQRY